MTAPRPYALLAEITYRCPLHCPYCSNPVAASLREATRRPQGGGYSDMQALNGELTSDEWKRVIRDAATLGVLQIGFSGGEPLVRRDLAELVHTAREANLYTNLITSGIGFDDDRIGALRDAEFRDVLFGLFGGALVFTIIALVTFAIEMMMAGRGLRVVVRQHQKTADKNKSDPKTC